MQLIEAAAGPAADQPRPSKLKDLLLKIVLLTILSVALGWAQGWAASRTYKPEHVGGFHTGLLHGLLMPAALPGLLLGQNLPIYAPNNSGRGYNIGTFSASTPAAPCFLASVFGSVRDGSLSYDDLPAMDNDDFRRGNFGSVARTPMQAFAHTRSGIIGSLAVIHSWRESCAFLKCGCRLRTTTSQTHLPHP